MNDEDLQKKKIMDSLDGYFPKSAGMLTHEQVAEYVFDCQSKALRGLELIEQLVITLKPFYSAKYSWEAIVEDGADGTISALGTTPLEAVFHVAEQKVFAQEVAAVLDPDMRQTLINLGWTPPEEKD